ncbi:aryl-alcohol dehydrogenase-like predicted oxidoreductase [Actinoplanes lutulentus]|uniref:Aryl-alcohol dehydrogenase-like predicted oxidoreductase n=1 Tax=Actinoplanes lutulentus TaxID=1287878 RepID=A0A327YX78_9ACTN|nr:aldo/keto reductase [Actinoplanes lutulentus]MBB2940439.1 aryl-alcohol dehydrogenase-like predicted oxidoreductase [Actinoplanes lutulentus]RAK25829.1 aryl-alcohol dehydrogenase-like predicted oxidoreductase [Actinoplanes lutulentus]
MTLSNSGTIDLGGKSVHRLGYGAMRITGPGVWGPPASPDEAIRVLRRSAELGVTFIDTADSYGPDVSEDLIREALHDGSGYGDIVIATKGGFTRHGPNQWRAVGRPEYLRQTILMSMRRLGVEQIDLWQLHRIDPLVPRDEQFGVLKAFLDEGLAKQVGLSEVNVEEVKAAQAAGVPVASVQNRYNLGDRRAEELLDYCTDQGIAFIPWAPVDAGTLARPGGPLEQISQAHPGTTTGQLALAWLLRRSPVVVPIPGTSSVTHLEENLAAADVKLTDDEYEALAKAA